MGVELRLLPFVSKDRSSLLSHEIWDVGVDYDLWEKFGALPQWQLEKLTCFLARDDDSEPKYGDAVDTPYGEKITCTTAGTICTLKDHPAVQDNWRNRGLWKYLAEMPADWPIALYWH